MFKTEPLGAHGTGHSLLLNALLVLQYLVAQTAPPLPSSVAPYTSTPPFPSKK